MTRMFLILAVLCEVAATMSLRASDGLITELWVDEPEFEEPVFLPQMIRTRTI